MTCDLCVIPSLIVQLLLSGVTVVRELSWLRVRWSWLKSQVIMWTGGSCESWLTLCHYLQESSAPNSIFLSEDSPRRANSSLNTCAVNLIIPALWTGPHPPSVYSAPRWPCRHPWHSPRTCVTSSSLTHLLDQGCCTFSGSLLWWILQSSLSSLPQSWALVSCGLCLSLPGGKQFC